jgi:AraC-like DNA-binding protein
MISKINSSELLRDVSLEYIHITNDTILELTTSCYDILYLVNGECRVDDDKGVVRLSKYSPTILHAGFHSIVCHVGDDALFELVIIHVERRELFNCATEVSREQQRFETAVLKGVASNISVEELSSMCYLSVSTFKRRFHDYYHIPPHRWFLCRRLEIASAILHKTSLPTFTIARLCGFINVSHFIATFKRRYGTTPSRLMRREAGCVKLSSLSSRLSSQIG